MSGLKNYHQSRALKLMLIGDSGTGKTGMLASLVKDGYNVRVIDFDNGTEYLMNKLISWQNKGTQLKGTIHYQTVQDKHKPGASGEVVADGKPEAYSKAVALLKNWDGGEDEQFGSINEWTNKDILVIDSLTLMCTSIMRKVLFLNGRTKREWQDYNATLQTALNFLNLITDKSLPCHVIFMTHINYISPEGTNIIQGFPASIGKELSIQIPRYFNNIIGASKRGSGNKEEFILHLKSKQAINLKTSIVNVPETLPAETGLAEFFRLMLDGSAVSIPPTNKPTQTNLK